MVTLTVTVEPELTVDGGCCVNRSFFAAPGLTVTLYVTEGTPSVGSAVSTSTAA